MSWFPTSDAWFYLDSITKIKALVIEDKNELMNSRDSIIVTLAAEDLQQALLSAHFPVSDDRLERHCHQIVTTIGSTWQDP